MKFKLQLPVKTTATSVLSHQCSQQNRTMQGSVTEPPSIFIFTFVSISSFNLPPPPPAPFILVIKSLLGEMLQEAQLNQLYPISNFSFMYLREPCFSP